MRGTCFSALQRAENSSIWKQLRTIITALPFQCSSASRKFLNRFPLTCCLPVEWFQCSSASRKFLNSATSKPRTRCCRAFQCSSASRKFLNRAARCRDRTYSRVSVLFSEPKIPQSPTGDHPTVCFKSFSALQRAENSSICATTLQTETPSVFQCSSASRKFLNSSTVRNSRKQSGAFQCSSASRKFLNSTRIASMS